MAIAVAWCAVLISLLATPAAAQRSSVLLTEANGAITPVVAGHLEDAVERADRDGHEALLVRLDTPGGLVASMRRIVRTFLNAEVPVIVWVAPAGAGAASAGYIITTSAHVASMSPGTNIGAATPVDMEGGEVIDKVVEDAVSYSVELAELRGRNTEFAEEATRDGRSAGATEAAEIGVVDFLASSIEEVLAAADGTEVELRDGAVTLAVAGAEVVEYEMSWARRILQALANPNLAFIFLSIAPLAILYEIAQPGVGAGLVVGVVCLVLALFAVAVLPVNIAGLMLLLLAIGLFVAEAFAPGVGVAAAGGTVALVLAGIFLFQRPTGIGVDLVVLLPTALVAGGLALGVAYLARKTWLAPSATAVESYEGHRATVRHVRGEQAQVMYDGALWSARSTEARLQEGEEVRILERDGLEFIVEPVGDGDPDGPDTPDD